MRRRWWKTSRRRWLLFLVLLIAAALPIANETTRRVAESMLGSSFDGNATVERVRLGVRNVHVEGITVFSRDCAEPVVAIDSIAARLSILDGLRYGVWIKTVVVDRPQLQLHFDEHGQLITHLPESDTEGRTSQPTTHLPFQSIAIRNAGVAIHQIGRASFLVSDIAVGVNGAGSQLAVTADVPDVLSGKIAFHSKVDVANLIGETTVDILNLNVHSEQLTQLPLVPSAIHDQPWHAVSSLRLRQTGSLANVKGLGANIDLDEFRFSMSDRPDMVCVAGHVQLNNGEFTSNVEGKLLGGGLKISSAGSVDDVSTGTLRIDCIELDSNELPEGLIPSNVATKLTVGTTFDATYEDGQLHFQGTGTARTSSTNAMGIAIAPTTVRLEVDATKDSADSERRLHGLLSATIISDGVSLEQLAANGIKRLPHAFPTESDHLTQQPQTPKLPEFITPSGQVRAAARIEVPLPTLADPQTYFVKGSVDATGVVVNDILVKHGKGEFALENNNPSANFSDIVLLDQINGQESSLTAVASTMLDQTSNVQAALRVNHLSAATIARFANVGNRQVDGDLLARVILDCPLARIDDPSIWHGEAIVQARAIRIDDKPLTNFTATCQMENGVLSLRTTDGDIAGGVLTGNATIETLKPYPFRADAKIRRLMLDHVGDLVGTTSTAISGAIDASLSATGTLLNNKWRANGQLAGSQLRFGSRHFDDSELLLEANPNTIAVRAPSKGFLGGDFGLTLTELQHIEGHIGELPLAAVARIAGINESIDGSTSCKFSTNIATDLSELNSTAIVTSPGIAVRNASLNQVRTELSLRDGRANIQAHATGLGGEFRVEARANAIQLAGLTAEQWQSPSELPIDAIGAISNIKLSELWPIIGQRDQLQQLNGKISITVERGNAERDRGTIAAGDLKVRDVRWDNVLWSNQLHADIDIGDRLIELREFSGPFASGRLNGRGRVALNGTNNGTFEFTANRVSLQKALVPLDRRGELAKGLVSMRINGRLGARPSGRAFVSMDRGTAGPIALTRLRFPVDWSVDPTAKSVQWRTTNGTVGLGGGRVVTNAKGRWNGKLDMTMTTSARRVDTGRIMAGRSSGSGYLDGTLRLTAQRAIAADDFTGTFDATLSDASSLQLPVVSDLTKFLKTMPSTTSFDESRVQGRIGNGIVHLDRVTLAAANAQVLAEGTTTLGGRLNLQVMAKTDQTGPADKLLELADSPLLMAAPTPIGLVAKANNALKDRVVHLRIGGTAARPVIRLEPGRQIGQEAIKFFMNQAIALRNKNDELSFR